MNVFLITAGVFCVLHIVPAHPWLPPPIAQWLELEAKENQVYSMPEEQALLVKRIQALEKSILARKKQMMRNLE